MGWCREQVSADEQFEKCFRISKWLSNDKIPFGTWKQPGQLLNSSFKTDFDLKLNLVQPYENQLSSKFLCKIDFLKFYLGLTFTNFDDPNKLYYVWTRYMRPKFTILNQKWTCDLSLINWIKVLSWFSVWLTFTAFWLQMMTYLIYIWPK